MGWTQKERRLTRSVGETRSGTCKALHYVFPRVSVRPSCGKARVVPIAPRLGALPTLPICLSVVGWSLGHLAVVDDIPTSQEQKVIEEDSNLTMQELPVLVFSSPSSPNPTSCRGWWIATTVLTPYFLHRRRMYLSRIHGLTRGATLLHDASRTARHPWHSSLGAKGHLRCSCRPGAESWARRRLITEEDLCLAG